MIKWYAFTLLPLALLGGSATASPVGDGGEPADLFIAQIYGYLCETPTMICPLDYEDQVGSPCQCTDEEGYSEYGFIVAD